MPAKGDAKGIEALKSRLSAEPADGKLPLEEKIARGDEGITELVRQNSAVGQAQLVDKTSAQREQAHEWEQVKRRGRSARRQGRRSVAGAPAVPLAALATANPFAPLAELTTEP